jgi:hypothetical protein
MLSGRSLGLRYRKYRRLLDEIPQPEPSITNQSDEVSSPILASLFHHFLALCDSGAIFFQLHRSRQKLVNQFSENTRYADGAHLSFFAE